MVHPHLELNMKTSRLFFISLAESIALSGSPSFATEAQDKLSATITESAYNMTAFKEGKDISNTWIVKSIKYSKDGSATSTLRAGVEVKSTWSLDDAANIITLKSPGQGETRWEILEASSNAFRKRNVVSGVEVVQTPK
jgi:hypothetical protein